jgi:hypothetical protein
LLIETENKKKALFLSSKCDDIFLIKTTSNISAAVLPQALAEEE